MVRDLTEIQLYNRCAFRLFYDRHHFLDTKGLFERPEICLNFGTLNSANERIRTKNAISSVAISAKVAIQAGAPCGGHFGHSSSCCSSSSNASSAITSTDLPYYPNYSQVIKRLLQTYFVT